VSLNVSDVPTAIDFYVGTLGCSAREDRPDFGFAGAWLDVGGQQIHLIEAPPVADLGQHLALHVEDIAASIDELRAQGVKVSDPFPVGAGQQAFLHDPAGNLVELHQPASA
jgi:catechol 2,3-dioxygenase-like lactoylglutathione lyase family enzyme